MTLALVNRQVATTTMKTDKTVDKWKVFRDTSEAREVLGLQDRSLAILNALLSFYPENELRQDAQLIVFPSNAQLTIRAHGIAGATLRRHLALLVDAGLIVRRDSANGKRYARKGVTGDIETAFGFDLSPLLLRAEELASLAQQVAHDRAAFRKAKEDLTICRRDVRKLISAALDEGAAGNWNRIENVYIKLVARIPRNPAMSELCEVLDEMRLLRDEVLNALDDNDNSKEISTNDAHNERHIQNSDSESIIEFEPALEKERERNRVSASTERGRSAPLFPLGMVLRACGEILAYGPSGSIASWGDLMQAAVVVRSTLGVSPSAYQEACDVMGAENAAVTMACILERAGYINSPGAYLRNLTERARRGGFSLGPALMALLRSRGALPQKAG